MKKEEYIIGERVKCVHPFDKNKVGTITHVVMDTKEIDVIFDYENHSSRYYWNNFIKLNKQNTMNTIQLLIKKLSRTEPEKTFVDVGFLNENEEITDDGKEALITILWNKNKSELKELADKLNEATKTNR